MHLPDSISIPSVVVKEAQTGPYEVLIARNIIVNPPFDKNQKMERWSAVSLLEKIK
jgi:hypothetical protein